MAEKKVNRGFALRYKGGRCIICGYARTGSSLVFYRPDKKRRVEIGIGGVSQVKNLADGCVLLCTNCAGEVEDGLFKVDSLIPDEEIENIFGKVLDAPKVSKMTIRSTMSREWVNPKGIILEFGVGKGNSIMLFSKIFPESKIYGFDWFKGLPEFWRVGKPAGAASLEGADWRKINFGDNVEIIYGLFQDTLEAFLERENIFLEKKVTLIHFDCDIYSSHYYALMSLANVILEHKPILLFDDFYKYAGYGRHGMLAFKQFCDKYPEFKWEVICRDNNKGASIKSL